MTKLRLCLLGFSLVTAGTSLNAADSSRSGRLPAPLFDGLGDLHHPITTSSPRAQRYFDQGLILLYGFNHAEAVRSFTAAAQLDTNCAMAWWGVAAAYGPHVNLPMPKENVPKAWDALQRALALKSGASPREQAYIDALTKRYQAEAVDDRSALEHAYADAMRAVARQYPDDLEAAALFAESVMDTMPWDYWTKDKKPKPATEEVIATLRGVLARNPRHPGASHFLIHAVEAGPNPELALPAANRLLEFAPAAGHLVHMPAHIFARVGQYRDAVDSNERAIKADRSYIRQVKAQGFYPGVYFPHNMHFLWYASLLEGRASDSLLAARRVSDYAMDRFCGTTQVLEAPRFRHLPWLTQARFGRWDDLLKVPQPAVTNDFLVDRIVWHFVRGLALCARGDGEAAAREHAALQELVATDSAKKLNNPQFPATSIFGVAEHALAGKVAAARGDTKAALGHLENAVAAEDKLPYMEPPYWPYPSRQLLGAACLRAGDLAKAEKAFREDLEILPRNGWALFGLEETLRHQGRTEAAASVGREFHQAWKLADGMPDLSWY